MDDREAESCALGFAGVFVADAVEFFKYTLPFFFGYSTAFVAYGDDGVMLDPA